MRLGICFPRLIRLDAVAIKRPAARGPGLGRALAGRALTGAHALGATPVLRDTGVWMTDAQALHERPGFGEILPGPKRGNPPEVADLLPFMELVLPASVSCASP